MEKSIEEFKKLGWIWDGKIVEDTARSVNIAFLGINNSDWFIELVSPINEESHVYSILKRMKNVASPYHICYKTKSIEKAIESLTSGQYVLVQNAEPAIAFENRKVAFMFSRETGLIELLE